MKIEGVDASTSSEDRLGGMRGDGSSNSVALGGCGIAEEEAGETYIVDRNAAEVDCTRFGGLNG